MAIEPYYQYMAGFREYMKAWDLFDARMLLHFITRKNINKELNGKRWTDDTAFEAYRLGLRDDRVVLAHQSQALEGHAKVVKDCAIVREKMREFGEGVGVERPRKKVS
jgi:hypothetical protein